MGRQATEDLTERCSRLTVTISVVAVLFLATGWAWAGPRYGAAIALGLIIWPRSFCISQRPDDTPNALRTQRSDHLLTGRLFEDAGHRMVPTHATKAGIRYL